jgi:hypothetical protein
MNGALTADAASCGCCASEQASAESTGCEGTCRAASGGKECGKASGAIGRTEIEASPATGEPSRLWCPGKHEECAKCLLNESAPHPSWAVCVNPDRVEPSHPCSYRQVKL